MHRIDQADTVAAAPAQKAAVSAGYFADRDVAGGVAGTIIASDWLNAVQTELETLITDTGAVLNKASNNQVSTAVTYKARNPIDVRVSGTPYGISAAGVALFHGGVSDDGWEVSSGDLDVSAGAVNAISADFGSGGFTVDLTGLVQGTAAWETSSTVTSSLGFLAPGANATLAALDCNSDAAGAPSIDVRALRISRGTSDPAYLGWDESDDAWTVDRRDGAGPQAIVTSGGTVAQRMFSGQFSIATNPGVVVGEIHGWTDFDPATAICTATVVSSDDADMQVWVTSIDATSIDLDPRRGGGGGITVGNPIVVNVIMIADAA
jgi:hypothetical protein